MIEFGVDVLSGLGRLDGGDDGADVDRRGDQLRRDLELANLKMMNQLNEVLGTIQY
jgi:hypothetical protein